MNKENVNFSSSHNNTNKVFKTYDKNVNYKSENEAKTQEAKTQSGKPLRYSEDSFTKVLIGKKIRLTLVNGAIKDGKLLELGMYDIKIETMYSTLIVMKSAIMTVEVLQ